MVLILAAGSFVSCTIRPIVQATQTEIGKRETKHGQTGILEEKGVYGRVQYFRPKTRFFEFTNFYKVVEQIKSKNITDLGNQDFNTETTGQE